MRLEAFKKVSVCVLSYNRCPELEFTLNTLYEQGDLFAEVLVADNGSTDGSLEMLAAQFPQVQVYSTGGNVGNSGWNCIYEKAQGDWVLSLDDDSHPVIETLGPIAEAIHSGCSAAAIACSMRKDSEHLSGKDESLVPGYGFSSAGVFLNKKALNALGGYDPELFMFMNDLDWAARALATGWEILRCDSATVIHRATPLQRSRARHAYYYCRNTLLWILYYVPAPLQAQYLARYCRDVALFTVLHQTFHYAKALWEGVRLFRKNKAKELPKLTEAQLNHVCPDFRAPFAYLG